MWMWMAHGFVRARRAADSEGRRAPKGFGFLSLRTELEIVRRGSRCRMLLHSLVCRVWRRRTTGVSCRVVSDGGVRGASQRARDSQTGWAQGRDTFVMSLSRLPSPLGEDNAFPLPPFVVTVTLFLACFSLLSRLTKLAGVGCWNQGVGVRGWRERRFDLSETRARGLSCFCGPSCRSSCLLRLLRVLPSDI